MVTPRRILATVAMAATVLASCTPPPGNGDPDTVIFIVGDSGASLAGHPGRTVLGFPSPKPGYTPWGWTDGIFPFPGYHPGGYVTAALDARGFENTLVVPRAVWGSHGEDWAQADETVCQPGTPEDDPKCVKSPGEVADEIAHFRGLGARVIIWFSIGVAPVAHVLGGETTSLGWSDTATWNQRLEAERGHIDAAISILRSGNTGTPAPPGTPEPVFILPGYANLSADRDFAFGQKCGDLSAEGFQLDESARPYWDAMLNPLLSGGGTALYDGVTPLGSAHPSGVSGILHEIAAGDPDVAHVNPGLALRDDASTVDPWAPSPDDAIFADCIHLSSTGAERLVDVVLDGTLPQLGLDG